jgi:hypothetical protein
MSRLKFEIRSLRTRYQLLGQSRRKGTIQKSFVERKHDMKWCSVNNYDGKIIIMKYRNSNF